MNTFETKIAVRWSDCDLNRHVRHSAYYDYGAHTRIQLFNSSDFPIQKMAALNIGPILFKEECSFLAELTTSDTVTINVLKDANSGDSSKFKLHHEMFNQKGIKCAHLTVQGAWMDLGKRKLIVPPQEIVDIFNQLAEGEDFVYKKR